MLFADENGLSDPSGIVVDEFGTLGSIQPTGPLNWLVTQYDPNAFAAGGNYASEQDEPIFNPINKWVTVDQNTGGVHVASAAVPIPPAGGFAGDLRAKILQSLAIANDRQSAGQ